jgi:uncharacterized membrane protein YedE/YeeE
MIAWLSQPWPWYVSGPLLGLFVPVLLLVGNKQLGISRNLRHLCAALAPQCSPFFRYEWKATGLWNLAFLAGIAVGGFIGGQLLAGPVVAIAASTRADLAALGVHDFSGLAPHELFSWSRVLSLRGLALLAGGGFLVGFGTAYAGGCTSGHGISGLANRELPSLIAVLGFFAGGLLATYLLLPALL